MKNSALDYEMAPSDVDTKRNALLLHYRIEEKLDQGDICFVPVHDPNCKTTDLNHLSDPPRYVVDIVNDQLRMSKENICPATLNMPWCDLHGMPLNHLTITVQPFARALYAVAKTAYSISSTKLWETAITDEEMECDFKILRDRSLRNRKNNKTTMVNGKEIERFTRSFAIKN
jgi:hypothetical protein